MIELDVKRFEEDLKHELDVFDIPIREIDKGFFNLNQKFIYVFTKYKCPIDFIDRWSHLFSKKVWDTISMYQSLSESFIEKHQDKINWFLLFGSQELDDEFVLKWIYKIKMRHFFGLECNDKIKWKTLSIDDIFVTLKLCH